MTEPVEGCPQGSEPWRERAWTPEQMERFAERQREVFSDRFAAMETQGNE
jgi:hypothetical protein